MIERYSGNILKLDSNISQKVEFLNRLNVLKVLNGIRGFGATLFADIEFRKCASNKFR